MASAAGVVPSSIRLHYFNVRARAEFIRYILTYAQVPFVDNRIERPKWPQIKPKFPLGQVPVLEYQDTNGKTHLLVQSAAIARTCSRWFDLAGKTMQESAHVEEVYETLRDLSDATSKVAWEKDTSKKEALLNEVKSQNIPKILGYLNNKLQANGGNFIAGGKSISAGDLCVAVNLDQLSREISFSGAYRPPLVDLKALEKDFPGLFGVQKRVEETPSIKRYLASRPDSSI